MELTCHVCKLEFPIPKISSKLWYKCPKCGTMIQLWGYHDTYIKPKDPGNKIGGIYGMV